MNQKLAELRKLLRSMGSAAVAFSGGVDSALLAVLAQSELAELGDKNFAAVTVDSPLLAACERRDAIALVDQCGLRHVLLKIDELDDANIAANSPERCYYCKKLRFTYAVKWCLENGLTWLLDGSNLDDFSDYRPGMKALRELKDHVRSPFLEVGITKSEIRELSRQMGLFTWAKPARACLASRVPYGISLTRELLHRIDVAESALAKFLPDNTQFRVRVHSAHSDGELARIEIEPELAGVILEHATQICSVLKKTGFKYITLDLDGYRMGSLNEVLKLNRK